MSTAHFKFIEWRDTKGLHEDTSRTLSELKFLKDELQFLESLVDGHTLEFIYGKNFIESNNTVQQLNDHKLTLKELMRELKQHRNGLEVLLDDIDVPNELKDYKDEHYRLMIAAMDFQTDLKKTKRLIFKMITEGMKKGKRKKMTKS